MRYHYLFTAYHLSMYFDNQKFKEVISSG